MSSWYVVLIVRVWFWLCDSWFLGDSIQMCFVSITQVAEWWAKEHILYWVEEDTNIHNSWQQILLTSSLMQKKWLQKLVYNLWLCILLCIRLQVWKCIVMCDIYQPAVQFPYVCFGQPECVTCISTPKPISYASCYHLLKLHFTILL